MESENKPLTDKQQKFVEKYVKSFNGTQSAIAAGFSKKTAKTQASFLLNQVNIQTAVLQQVKCQRLLLDHESKDVVAEAAAIAFSDISDTCSWEEDSLKLIGSENIPKVSRKTIKKITCRTVETEKSTNTTVSIELHDKMKALEFLGRYWSLADAGNKSDRDLGAQFKRVLDAARRVATSSEKRGGSK